MLHRERHRTQNIGWLRAAVLGANDGIISTASLIIGVAAAHMAHNSIVIAGIAALVAGAMSMAAGEYVSVSSQADIEKVELDIERKELETDQEHEIQELTDIYIQRGLEGDLARKVAIQLMAHDALAAHARDELGITETLRARPIQAALSSAASFSIGAALPIIVIFISSQASLLLTMSIATLFFLGLLGGLAAYIGGAHVLVGTIRVMFWGALAMILTAGIGSIFGVS